MRMAAADAADSLRHFPDRPFEVLRQVDRLAGAIVESGSQVSAQRLMLFLPKVEREDAISPTKEQSRRDFWTSAAARER
jgi:hypothetical protein